jgi:hypothetical protein
MSATPELRFVDVPPLFAQAHRREFEKWARKASLPPYHLSVPVQNYGPPRPGHLDDRVVVNFTGLYSASCFWFEIRPYEAADLDAVVTWERYVFARGAERWRMYAQWGVENDEGRFLQ